MNLTTETLTLGYGQRITLNRAKLAAPYMLQVCEAYSINTVPRVAMFMAQVGHETNGLQWLSELWGPTKQQLRYEPPSDLAARLGNTQRGDGAKYMGHGWIQCTGRHNHRTMTAKLRKDFPALQVPDFEERPDLLATYPWAALVAGAYWDQRGINTPADEQDLEACTLLVNGGVNGIDDRRLLLASCLPACYMTLGL